MRRTGALWASFVVLLGACGASQPQCRDAHVEAEARTRAPRAETSAGRWRGHARAVDVHAVRARVRIERASGDEVEIASRDRRERARIEARGDTVVVEGHDGGAIDLRVPRGVAVHVTTVNGAIDARALDGELDARTVSGAIKARVVGSSDDKRVSLRTVSGPVLLDFADGASAHVHVETMRERGRIDTHVGEGGGEIDVSTVSGPVKIRRPHEDED